MGNTQTLTVATFTDSDGNTQPSNYTATIQWGDGSSSSGTVSGSNGVFAVQGSHTYSVDSLSQPGGVYQVTVTIADNDGETLTGSSTVAVVRSPLAVYASNIVESSGGVVNNALVAVFSDPNASDSSAAYSATIDWGDGTTSAATSIVQNGNLFAVYGSHIYAQAQVEPVAVTIDWGDPVPQARVQKQAVPPAAPAKMDNLSAAVRNLFHDYVVAGGSLTLGTLNRLMDNPKITGSDAAAAATLKGYILNTVGKESKPAPNANLFVKNLRGWDPSLNGITLADVTYFEDNFNGNGSGAALQPIAKNLNSVYQNYVKRIENTKKELWARGTDWAAAPAGTIGTAWSSVSQGAEGDCAFLSVTIALEARDKNDFQKRILTVEQAGKPNSYQVIFGELGNPQKVDVSAPTDAQIALYASAGAGGLWLSIWEKAYVQLYQKDAPFGWLSLTPYDTLEFGEPLANAMQRVTGHKGVVYSMGQANRPAGLSAIQKAIKSAANNQVGGYRLMAFDVNDQGAIAKSLGISKGGAHALGIAFVGRGNATIQNPWNTGGSQYGGRFSLTQQELYNYGRFLVIEDTEGMR